MTTSPVVRLAMTTPDVTAQTGSLRPSELANAAVMAAVCSAIAVITVTLPFAFPLSLVATVPMALLAYRHRLRVLVAATVAGTIIAFLIINLGGLLVVVGGAYTGGLVGIVKRRGRGAPTALCAALVAGTVFGLFGVATLTVLSRMRTLIFETITGAVDGVAVMIGVAPALAPIAQGAREIFMTAMRFWPVLVIAFCVTIITFVAMVGWWALSRVLARLGGVPDVRKLDLIPDRADDRRVEPVPATFRDVCFRYPGADHDALGPVNLTVEPGEHLAITGANGSGKTTLLLLLSGRAPTSGTVVRPGAVGLGRFGGTAVVMQHPESQVLGTRVIDDVVWGLPPDVTVDAEELLAEVGLAGLGERDTGGLSGGELQRLAVASALAREPRLLIADEVTSMVDQDGRNALVEVLAGLTQHHDMALVHITHYNDEAATADRTVNLTSSTENLDLVITAPSPATPSAPHHHIGDKILELSGVTHRYSSGTPWESTALRDIDLSVGEGDGLLIHGLNGSGKSTLAWIMAGLLVPTTGSCLLDGEPVSDQIGAVAISFQAARLQLMRGRVDLEIASAAGFDHQDRRRVEQALAAVGLDPNLMCRRIDQLSGGQMRRVVLAGLLARSPRAIILDEPLAGLDAVSRRGLLRLLADLRRNTGLTVIVISHDFSGLKEVCPRTLHLHEGTLVPMPTTTEGTA